MGKNARIQELEEQIAALQKNKLSQDAMDFIVQLAQVPEDAVLLYTVSNQRVQNEVGKAARCLLDSLRICHPT